MPGISESAAAFGSGVTEIGKQLAEDAQDALTADERAKVLEWTAALGVAYANGDRAAVERWGTALNGMLGVAIFRTAESGRKAALRFANLALTTLVKVGLAALA